MRSLPARARHQVVTCGHSRRVILALGVVALMLLAGCATQGVLRAPPGGRLTPGSATHESYSYDNTVSARCRNNPADCAALSGKEESFEPILRTGISVASASAALKTLDDTKRREIEEELERCADLARSELLLRHEGDFKELTPDADECMQPAKGAASKNVTWAMQLGTEMHEETRGCVEAALNRLRPGGFSLEQRYRFDRRTGRKKLVSPEEEALLAETHNIGELAGSLKPDVVIHAGDPLNPEAVYDFKFPCVNTDEPPAWSRYSDGPYQGSDQGRIYKEAFGPNVSRVVPRLGIIQ